MRAFAPRLVLFEMVGGTGFEPVTSAMSTQTGAQQLDSYLSHMGLRGLSKHYANRVSEFLTRYIRYASQVSPESAISFLKTFLNRKPNTRARYSTYLKGFLSYLGMTLDLKVKVPRQLPTFVAYDDIVKLRESLGAKHTHKSSQSRDLVLLETAIKTGLRRSELANLLVANIDFKASRLMVVNGKGNKDRVIPLLPSLTTRLKQLCIGKRPNETVFGLKARSLGMKFYVWAKKAGVPLHTHSFRHYFATTLVEKGASVRVVQELLGHSNLNTTQVYLSVTANHLEDAIGLLDE